MFSWIKSMFVSKESVGKIVDAGISAGDKLFYTAEEKADHNLKVREWYISLLNSMKPFNVAMRLLALGVFAMWAFHLIVATGFYIAAFFICDPAAATCTLDTTAQAIELQMKTHIDDHFSVIIMFYFGAAGLNSIVATAKGGKNT